MRPLNMESEMIWEKWPARLEAIVRACERHGGMAEPIVIGAPATRHRIAEFEQEHGYRLDESLTQVLVHFSAEVAFKWHLPNGVQSAAFPEIQYGEMSWSLSKIAQAEECRRRSLKGIFSHPEDVALTHWDEKFAIMEIPNGDMIALDLSGHRECPIVYLDHEDMAGPAYRLGNNFVDFIDRWTRLGCPGPEGWLLIPFIPSAASGLEPDGENAREWRTWFGLEE